MSGVHSNHHESFGRVRSHAEQLRGLIDNAANVGPNGAVYRALHVVDGVIVVLTLVCQTGKPPAASVVMPFHMRREAYASLSLAYSAAEEIAVFFGLASAPLPTLTWSSMPLAHPRITFYQHPDTEPEPEDVEPAEEDQGEVIQALDAISQRVGWNADTVPVDTVPLKRAE